MVKSVVADVDLSSSVKLWCEGRQLIGARWAWRARGGKDHGLYSGIM